MGDAWPGLIGEFSFLRPQATFDREGGLHVFWAEPEAQPASQPERTAAIPITLWHAHLSPEKVWSTPRRVSEAERISWTREFATVGVDADGRLHVFAPSLTASEWWTTAHRADSDGEWQVAARFPRSAYVSVDLDRQTPLAAYVAGSPQYGRNTVFAARFDGREWQTESEPLGMSDGGLEAGFVRVLKAGAGEAQVVWARGGITGDVEVFHATYHQGRWSRPEGTGLESAAVSIDAVADRCEVVHLLYTAWDRSGVPVLRYRRWADGWSGELPAPATPVAVDPSLGLTPEGDPVVVWTTAVDSSSGGAARAATVWSRLPVHVRGTR